MTHSETADVLIIGGGLAGLCSAIDLSSHGVAVIVIEKNTYPMHKVCGEYVSNETLPYLKKLGVDPFKIGAVRIDELDFVTPDGSFLRTVLPLGGFGISRHNLDHALMKKAVAVGCRIITDQVEHIQFEEDGFTVYTKKDREYNTKFVIGAYGKRSMLDRRLERRFMKKKSSYVAVKAHYKGDFKENRVGLYHFEGGYCGVSKVEQDRLNICYIADTRKFGNFKGIEDFQDKVLKSNKHLDKILNQSQMIFKKPLTISQISFDRKELLVDHILMCGDSAGLIHPLCGNGMGMAIGGARLVSEAILSYFNGQLKSREEVEKHYVRSWNQNFRTRLRAGHSLAALLRFYKISFFLLPVLRRFPSLLHRLIKLTHGKPIVEI